jgi:hypothetical protein
MVARKPPVELGPDASIVVVIDAVKEMHGCIDEFKLDTRHALEDASAKVGAIARTQEEVKAALDAQIQLGETRYAAQVAYQALMLEALKIKPQESPGDPPPKASVGIALPVWPTIGAASGLIAVITAIDKLWPLLVKIPQALGGN